MQLNDFYEVWTSIEGMSRWVEDCIEVRSSLLSDTGTQAKTSSIHYAWLEQTKKPVHSEERVQSLCAQETVAAIAAHPKHRRLTFRLLPGLSKTYHSFHEVSQTFQVCLER